MASSQFWCEDNGTAGGTPPRGATSTTGITNVNWGSKDLANLDYTTYIITGGTNSYDKQIYLLFSGSFNQLLNAKFNSVSGDLGSNVTLKCLISGSGNYTTPSQNTNASLVRDLTSTGSTSTGLVVPFLSSGFWNNDYTLTVTSGAKYNSTAYAGAICYTPGIITQLIVGSNANPGTNPSARVFSLVWDEN